MTVFKDQRGVALVLEVILVVTVLITASYVGYRVYKSKQGTTTTSTNQEHSKQEASPQSTNTQYFVSNELGIKFPLNSQLKDLKLVSSYEELDSYVGAEHRRGEPAKVKRLMLSINTLNEATKSCNPSAFGYKPGTVVVIDRYGGSHHEIHGGTAPDAHKHFSAAYEFPDFHLLVYPSSERFNQCLVSDSVKADAEQVEDLLEEAIKKVESL